MKIREATLTDAEGIAKVHVDSWRSTYKDIVPSDYLDGLSYTQRTELWNQNINLKENHVLVAENDNGEIIGFACANTVEEADGKRAGKLTAIYLLEEYQGQGVGKELMVVLFQYFKREGCKKVFVEVLEENKTKNFYEYYGAKHVETVQISIGGQPLNEFIYVWDDIELVLGKFSS